MVTPDVGRLGGSEIQDQVVKETEFGIAARTQRPDVTVIIVSYNTREWLSTCLDALPAARAGIEIETIVVDNASLDGSADEIASRYPSVRLVRNESNIGFARAVNQGARLARGEFILLLNPDGYLRPRAISALVSFAKRNPHYVVVGGRTESPDGRTDPRSCWAKPTLWSLFCHATLLSNVAARSAVFNPESMPRYERDVPREVDIVSGCLLLIRRADWERMRGLDEDYFLYGEDADLCLRATKHLGRRCAITPGGVMVHAVSASSATRVSKYVMLMKGRVTVVDRFFVGWKRPVGIFVLRSGVLLRALLEVLGIRRDAQWREVWVRRRLWQHGYQRVKEPHGIGVPST